MDFQKLQADRARKRMNSVVQRRCCCFSSERFKDVWKYNGRGQCILKLMLAVQIFLYLANAGILIYDLICNVDGTHFAFHNKIDLFYLIVILWLFIASSYFLWHSTNRSIVVDLITYCVISILLNTFVMWRSLDMLFISKTIVNPEDLPPDTSQ